MLTGMKRAVAARRGWREIDERSGRTESASGTAYQPPAAAERAARIDGPPARHSAADSVRLIIIQYGSKKP